MLTGHCSYAALSARSFRHPILSTPQKKRRCVPSELTGLSQMSLIFCAPAAAGVKRKLKQQQANDYFFDEITLMPF
jgi:hypothetical protein